MCGRFGLTREERELAGEFSELNPKFDVHQLEPRYNIAPTQPVLTVRVDEKGQVRADELRWGVEVPAGAGRLRGLINVRAETALRPGLFRQLLDRRRVLVPASWFYEWRRRAGRRGEPLLIGPALEDGLVFAGLQGRWTDPDTGEIAPAVTILTTEPNGLVSEIHNRMPVILGRSSWGRWLDTDADAGDVADLLAPCPGEWLTTRPVSPLVNSVANEGPALLEPPAPEPAGRPVQLDLWVE